MRTIGASGPAPCTAATIVPSGAASIRYQTVPSMRPHGDTCGSRRSTVASAVVPCAAAGNVGSSWESARLSFGGGAARAGAARTSAARAVSKIFMPSSLRRRAHGALTRRSHGPCTEQSRGCSIGAMSVVEVQLLGPLEVRIDEKLVELRRPKQRALLALLALRAGEVVSTDRLVDELWGEAPPKSAVGSLQNLGSELRKALGPEVLLTRSPGYVLAVDRELVDAHRFERLVRKGQGDAEALRHALVLWRGPPLAELVS